MKYCFSPLANAEIYDVASFSSNITLLVDQLPTLGIENRIKSISGNFSVTFVIRHIVRGPYYKVSKIHVEAKASQGKELFLQFNASDNKTDLILFSA